METIHLSYLKKPIPDGLEESSAAIGFFDGVHLGHQKVIANAIENARQNNRKSAVITFYPHPSVILQKKVKHTRYITPLQEKEAVLKKMGVDVLYVVEFSKELSMLSPEEFIHQFLLQTNVRYIVAGYDFTFGYKGKGSMKEFGQYSPDSIMYDMVEKIETDGEKISSTKIRKYMDEGKIEKANQLLGRSLSLTGVVMSGDKRGRSIGYPTANLEVNDEYFLPKVGVYAVRLLAKGRWWNGMANLGYKPTFHAKREQPSLEVHLFDFQDDIYGEVVKLEWHCYIREEKKFNGVEQLVENLKRDEKEIRALF